MIETFLSRLPAPPEHVLHIGAGHGGWLGALADAGVPRMTLVEPDPEALARLHAAASDLPGVRILEAAVSDRAGPGTLHRFNFSQLNSLRRPAGLTELFPGLRLKQEETVSVMAPADLVSGLDLPSGSGLLIIEAPGEAHGILSALQAAGQLARFGAICFKAGRQPLYEDEVPMERTAAWLAGNGFGHEPEIGGEDSDLPYLTVRRDPGVGAAPEAGRAQAADAAAGPGGPGDEVAALRDELKAARRERGHARAALTRKDKAAAKARETAEAREAELARRAGDAETARDAEAEARRGAAEARDAAEARIAELERALAAAEDGAAKAEVARKAAEDRAAELARRAGEAETARDAEAEARRGADEARDAAEARIAELEQTLAAAEDGAAKAEAARKAAEDRAAELARRAGEAETARDAEAEGRRRADEAREAAEEQATARRMEAEAVEEARTEQVRARRRAQAHAEELEAKLAEVRKALENARTRADTLEAERDEAFARLAESHGHEDRLALCREDVLRAEGQIELIRDLLLRTPDL